MSNYDPQIRTAAGNRRRLAQRATGVDDAIRYRAALILTAADCDAGKHRTETDAETGDEVCRFCGAVVP